MTFDKYKEQIERLVPAVSSPDFELLLNEELADATLMDKMSIFIEVKRLHILCNKQIDLRQRIKTPCKEYTLIDGQKHWLDDIGYQIYLNEIPRYNNVLTEGIWEKITDVRNRFRMLEEIKANAQQEQIENDIYTGNSIEFGYYLHRKEARLNLSLSLTISITTEDKQPATSVDLSKSGLRLITNSHTDFELDKIIQIKYTGLIRYYPDLRTNLDYQIVKIITQPDSQVILQLKALDNSELYTTIFDRIRQNPAITTNTDKRDLYLRTRNYLYEYYYLNQTPTLPLLFKDNKPHYAILSPANQTIWQYWHDEKNLQEIGPFINETRLKKLAESTSQSLVVYCFKHEFKGKVFFFSATLDEMTPEIREIFWHFGAEKPSWRVFKLTRSEILEQDLEPLANIESSLIDPTGLTYLCQIQDITAYNLISDFYSADETQAPGSLINSYCHPRNSHHKITSISIAPQRNEERYNYALAVKIVYGEEVYTGKTIDFSPKGLNIRLDGFLDLAKDTQVAVNFPDLEKISKQISLRNIPYKVIRCATKENNIKLTLAEKNQGMLFFKKLIEVNKSKLSVNRESFIDHSTFETIHNLLLPRLNSIPLFIFNQDQKLSIKYTGVNFPLSPLAQLFENEDRSFGFKDILEAHFQSLIYLPLTQESNQESAHTLYLGIETLEDGQQKISHCQLVDSMKSQHEREQAIRDIQQEYKFKAVKFISHKVQKPSHLIKEIFAQLIKEDEEKATQLNQELHTLVGYAELIDTTHEILARANNSQLLKGCGQ